MPYNRSLGVHLVEASDSCFQSQADCRHARKLQFRQRAKTMTTSSDSLRAEKDLEQKQYALTRQVPDMAHGFTIVTAYGEITIERSVTSQRITELVEKMLLDELAIQSKQVP
jgi:hypothetical protein